MYIAEALPENQSLANLDLSCNKNLDLAGIIALSVSINLNTSLKYVDLTLGVKYATNLFSRKKKPDTSSITL